MRLPALVQHGGGSLEPALDAASTYGLHVLFLALVLGCVVLLRRLHREAIEFPEPRPRQLGGSSRAASAHGLLFPYEAAFLAGGPPRVVEVALATLLDEGWIVGSASGRLALGIRGDLVAALDPVASVVLGVIAARPPTAARDVRRRAARLPEVQEAGEILHARRLVVAPSTVRRLRRLRLAGAALLGATGLALLAVTASGSSGPASPPVVAAASLLVVAVAAPFLAWRRPLLRTAPGDFELVAVRDAVRDKARWVANRVWSDVPDEAPIAGWADVDRITDTLTRPPPARPVQLAWLWGRDDGLMAIAVRGPRAIPSRGLRRGLEGDRPMMMASRSSTGFSTPVHNIVRPKEG